jgi:plastocyanin
MKLAVVLVLAMTSLARSDRGVIRGTVKAERAAGVEAGTIVVYVVGFEETAAKQPVVVKQVGRKFVPDLIVVTAGGSVTFPNGDPFLHNVFSPTTERSFDLGSYPQGATRTRTFPRLGVLDIFCNIHPEMNATLVVLPNTRFAIADAQGKFELAGIPAGTWTVFAYSRAAKKPVKKQAVVTANRTTDLELVLEEARRDPNHKNKFGETYRETTIYAPGT